MNGVPIHYVLLLVSAYGLNLNLKIKDPFTTNIRDDDIGFPKRHIDDGEIEDEFRMTEQDRMKCGQHSDMYNSDCLKFLHIPKHAGTSIEAWSEIRGYRWGRHYLHQGLHRPRKDPLVMGPVVALAPWHAPPDYFTMNPYRGFHTFVVVRNPYDHMISEFRCKYFGYYAARPPVPLTFDAGAGGALPMEPKVVSEAERHQWRQEATAVDLNKWIKKMLKHAPDWWWGHIASVKYVTDEHGNHTVPPNNILHLENLTEEFDDLISRYNMKPGPLPTSNSDEDVPQFLIDDLTNDTLVMIEDVFDEDFKAFGYEQITKKKKN